MLSRYTMSRRHVANGAALPEGIRQDTRWRTHHLLRPTQEIVEAFLQDPAAEWKHFESAYLKVLEERFQEDPDAFHELAALATDNDVWLGCNCPTQKNPDVEHCHTWLALTFMKKHFSRLNVVFPKPAAD